MNRELGSNSLISVVVPVFNELHNLQPFTAEVRSAFQALDLPCPFEIVFVNDGSVDGSAERLDSLAEANPGEVRVIHFARNFGHAIAVTAGLDHACGDLVIVMDADMQDDPSAFSSFLAKWTEGFDVAYAIRVSREEWLPTRVLYWIFYRVFDWMAAMRFPLDAGDFSLMDRLVVDQISGMRERNRYIPGLRGWVGFRQAGVPVPRRARYDTHTRVGLRGLWTRAMNAIFSFSYVPLFVFRLIGTVALLASIALILFALYHKLITHLAVPAWTSEVITTSFFASINLLGISMLGEYVARIYDEVKGRPMYVVARTTGVSRRPRD